MTLEEKLRRVRDDLDGMYNAGADIGYKTGYNHGKEQGFGEGYETGQRDGEEYAYPIGVEDGKKAEYDRFWDNCQNYGNRVQYAYGFAGKSWNNETFKPKYNICPDSSASAILYSTEIEGDLVEILSALGVTLDLSKATNLSSAFSASYFITRAGVIDAQNAETVASMCSNCRGLITIDRFVLKSDGSQKIDGVFAYCYALKNITIEGTIGQNGFDIHWSTGLTHDSLMSIINALQDKTGDTSGTSWVCTLGTTNLTKLTDEEKLVATRKGWSLA